MRRHHIDRTSRQLGILHRKAGTVWQFAMLQASQGDSRHNRNGRLFQNRYKSIVCEVEPYLLELVRDIYLNPLRAGLAASLDELDHDRWSGHAVLLGNRSFSGQDANSILERIDNTLATAQHSYRQFSDGNTEGRPDELVGGELKRSQGEHKEQTPIHWFLNTRVPQGIFIWNQFIIIGSLSIDTN